MQIVQAIRPDREVMTRQRLPYFVGISGRTVGAQGLSMHLVVIPPGARADPHRHIGYETGIFVLQGKVLTRWGEHLENEVVSEAGDFLFVPPNVPHEAINLSETEAAKAVIARNDPAEQDKVEPFVMPSEPPDPYRLSRFVEAQAATYEEALAELRAGRKRTHWSWYVLPQIRGLGSSAMSVRYAIADIAEARAYLEHPLLGARLRECVSAMNVHRGSSAAAILGSVDARKFHSCITLFAQVAEADSPFHRALAKYFSGVEDAATMAMLASS